MDTLIFLLIFVMLLAMWRGRYRLGWVLFVIAFIMTGLLFWHHTTDALEISF